MIFNNKSIHGLYLTVLTALLTLTGCAHADDYRSTSGLKKLAAEGAVIFIAVDKNGKVIRAVDKDLEPLQKCRPCEEGDEEKWGQHCTKLLTAVKKQPQIFQEEKICRGLVGATVKSKDLILIQKTGINPTCLPMWTANGIEELCW